MLGVPGETYNAHVSITPEWPLINLCGDVLQRTRLNEKSTLYIDIWFHNKKIKYGGEKKITKNTDRNESFFIF